jgi:branched-chain amino acid transport system ATP-binding protein
MTVEENLQVGELIGSSRSKPATDLIFEYFPILKERRKQLAGTMSGGQQQQLAIGRALVGSPELLLLDEPSEGIQPSIVQMICRVLRSIRDDLGTTIVFVEQNLDTILALAERCVVMEKGQVIAEIPAGHVTPDSVRQHLLI